MIQIGRLKGESVLGCCYTIEIATSHYGKNPKFHAGCPSVREAIVFFYKIHFE